MTHQELDARSLAFHRLIAEKLRRDPSLFARVQHSVARWLADPLPSDEKCLATWARLVREGMEASLAVATEDSERAAELRQSSPFSGVLTPRERSHYLRVWKALHAAR